MIKSVHGKNLFSWEVLDYTIPSGISQVTGFNHDDGNREGCGKSAIFNIITWTCWGKIPKEAKVDECVREGHKDAEGRVVLTSGQSIIRRRGKGQGLCMVSVSGLEKKATQDEVDDLIGSMDLFCQTIYVPQNYAKNFIASDEEVKSKILTESRDIRVYDVARKMADEQLRAARDNLSVAAVYLKEAEDKIAVGRTETAWVTKQLDEFLDRKAERVAQINLAIEKAQAAAERVEEAPLEAAVVSARDQLDTIRKQVTELTATARSAKLVADGNARLARDISALNSKKSQLETELVKGASSNLCPTCGQETEKDKLHAHFESKKLQLQDVEHSLGEKTSQMMPEDPAALAKATLAASQEKDRAGALATAERLLHATRARNSAADAHRAQVETLRKERRAEKDTKPDALTAKLTECAERDERLELAVGGRRDEVRRLNELIERLETVRADFRAIKNDIFATAMQELSRDANSFLRGLFDTLVRIRFENQVERNVSKIKTFVTIEGKERSLGLYSGGQLRRISIAVDLALSKMVANRTGRSGGLRILDEPLRDLSPQSKERFMDLLKQLPGNTVLVEHDQIVQSMVASTFEIEFKGGVSQVTK